MRAWGAWGQAVPTSAEQTNRVMTSEASQGPRPGNREVQTHKHHFLPTIQKCLVFLKSPDPQSQGVGEILTVNCGKPWAALMPTEPPPSCEASRTKRGSSDLQYQGGREALGTAGVLPGRTSIRPQMGQHQALGTTDAVLRTTVHSSKLLSCLQSYRERHSLPPLTVHTAVPASGRPPVPT